MKDALVTYDPATPEGYVRVGYPGSESVECYINLKDTIKRQRKVEVKRADDSRLGLTYMMKSDPTVGYAGNCCGMGLIERIRSFGDVINAGKTEQKQVIKDFVYDVKTFDWWPRSGSSAISFNQFIVVDGDLKNRTAGWLMRHLPGLVVAGPWTPNKFMGNADKRIRAFLWIPPWGMAADADAFGPVIEAYFNGDKILDKTLEL